MIHGANHTILMAFNSAAQSLAASEDVAEIKGIRDKAEAVRKYARDAALGLEAQNQAAEIKLRAERRAGELLTKMLKHGGDRRSRSHRDKVKLCDLGINANQSARWRREAAVPGDIFEAYLLAAHQAGYDITAQGLLRLARCRIYANAESQTKEQLRRTAFGSDSARKVLDDSETIKDLTDGDEILVEMLREILNHRCILQQILTAWCKGNVEALQRCERRHVSRLLADIGSLVVNAQSILGRRDPSRKGRMRTHSRKEDSCESWVQRPSNAESG